MKHRHSIRNKTTLVIGGGRFGAKACRFFRDQKARIILVDSDPACAAREFVTGNDFIRRDARAAWDLALQLKPDFIAPTMPAHTCAGWIRDYFRLKPFPDLTGKVTDRIPKSVFLRGDESDARMVLSYMSGGKLCPENCPHLSGNCDLTGEPRPAPMFKMLEYAVFGLFDRCRIFESVQMAPGVGAIDGREFRQFMNDMERQKPGTVAVGTACLCHGVLNMFES